MAHAGKGGPNLFERDLTPGETLNMHLPRQLRWVSDNVNCVDDPAKTRVGLISGVGNADYFNTQITYVWPYTSSTGKHMSMRLIVRPQFDVNATTNYLWRLQTSAPPGTAQCLGLLAVGDDHTNDMAPGTVDIPTFTAGYGTITGAGLQFLAVRALWSEV